MSVPLGAAAAAAAETNVIREDRTARAPRAPRVARVAGGDLEPPVLRGTAADNFAASVRVRFPDFWFDVAGEPYAIESPHLIARETVETIRAAARDAWRIFAHVLPVVVGLPDDELVAIGVPANAIAACRDVGGPVPTLVGRFDFALTPAGPKLLEFNADTPFFLWESFEVAGALVEAAGLVDPNAGALETLRAGIARTLCDLAPTARVAVTAYNTWREDWFTGLFAARVASLALGRAVDVVPLCDLRVDERGAYDADGRRIDALWRFYPLEHLARDRAGDVLLASLRDGHVRTINPPHALLAQNKATLAIVWGLRQSAYVDAELRARIESIFLPTFLDLPSGSGRYVRKPVFGREGRSVTIYDAETIVEGALEPAYGAQPAIYQQYVELPTVALDGVRAGSFDRAIHTCFVVDGAACAVGMRVGGRITDVKALMVPLGFENGAGVF